VRADPHAGGAVWHAGAELKDARGVVILLHGRGASASDILGVSGALALEGVAFLAPEAAGSTWYPQSFLAPREENEPWLSSALKKIESLVGAAVSAGLERERIVLGGFSQGACLTTEFVATHPARYAGAIAWTGGLVGPLEIDLPAKFAGLGEDLAGMPALLTSGDPDPHVPWSRVEESARVLTAMGARVTTRRYPGKPHSINAEELDFARELVQAAFG
jgi:phospholipase/carboxylesterase